MRNQGAGNNRALAAQMARYAEQIRDHIAEELEPLEVRLAPLPGVGTRSTLEPAPASNESVSQEELAS